MNKNFQTSVRFANRYRPNFIIMTLNWRVFKTTDSKFVAFLFTLVGFRVFRKP